MKFHIINFILISIILYSCNAATENKAVEIQEIVQNEVDEQITESIIYQSASNGLADIRLSINPDGFFLFYMRTIPQPMDNEEEEAIINSTGNWSKKGEIDWLILTFNKDKPILNAVFDSNYADENQFKVMDDSTVFINAGLEKLSIRGVLCEREK